MSALTTSMPSGTMRLTDVKFQTARIPCIHHLVADRLRAAAGRCDDADARVKLCAHFRKPSHRIDRLPLCSMDCVWVYVKAGDDVHIIRGKPRVRQECLPELPHTHDHGYVELPATYVALEFADQADHIVFAGFPLREQRPDVFRTVSGRMFSACAIDRVVALGVADASIVRR